MILSIVMLPNEIMGLGVVLSVLLLIFLAVRNIAEAGNYKTWNKNLIIGIAPLLAAFLVIVVIKITEILGG